MIEFGIEDEPERPTKTLTVELVPSSAWGNNLRSKLPKKDWDKIRRAQYQSASNCCEICGGKGHRHPLECHEIWAYDDVGHVQKLEGLIALCPPCHRVKHLGFAFTQGKGDEAIHHMMRVNGWDRRRVAEYVRAAFETHAERSTYRWDLDLEWLRTVGVEVPA
jgi:hypothetical protein